MFSHAPPYLLVTRRHLLFRYHRRLSAETGSGPSRPDRVDLWIAKLVSTIFRLSPSPAAAADRLAPLRQVLSPSVIFTALRRIPDPLSALGLFNLSRTAFGVVHFDAAFRFMICCLCRSGLHDDALKVFDEMVSDGHSNDGPFMEFLANSCLEAGKLDLAIAFFHKASHLGYFLQPYTLNKLLTLLIEKNRVNDASVFLRQHLDLQSLSVDTFSFNIIIKGLCKVSDLDTALKFFNQMGSYGFLPDTVTHNILIDGLCKADQVDRGHKILQKIQLDGSCVPNVVTYTSLIHGYCKIGKMKEAYGIFDEMIGIGVRPSRITYNILIDGYGKVGDMLSAISLYERMLICGCPPDIVTFTSLIDGYCRNEQLDDAMKLWNEMNRRELKPNAHTFSVVIHYLCRKNRLAEARNLLKTLNGRRDLLPHAFIYNPVIDGLCKAGDVDQANVVLLEMEERQCMPDKFTYTILIIGHCKKGRMLEAIAIFQKMVNSGCAPDSITVGSLVSCLLKAGIPNEINKVMLIASGRNSKLDIPRIVETPLGKSMGISVAI
ncbi:hypothetical protein Cni_G15373 [Canna indica]|uniref:Pentatricopeptide repeat-containing protein n=1 Tax=Canna indica TaxID=4628 RepID=A0AAQ3KD99_9LILI|nr:hypothetical protein Cni_G15373 [Canna indica]